MRTRLCLFMCLVAFGVSGCLLNTDDAAESRPLIEPEEPGEDMQGTGGDLGEEDLGADMSADMSADMAAACDGEGAPDCGAHGQCDDSSGQAACVCDEGYAGDDCGACDAGYQDNDQDSVCEPDCVTAALGCGANSQCDASSGQAACVCAMGYQDNDMDGTCEPDCATAALGCGANSQCDDSSGQAVCVCDEGYQDNDGDLDCAEDCATAALGCGINSQCDDSSGQAACVCDEGYQDNDGDLDCAPSCMTAQLDCSGNGQCDDASGAAICVCEAGYAGATCDTCEAGYQDNDMDGACEPDCATAALGCEPHGACDDASGAAVCSCDTGYTGAACDLCEAGYQDNDMDGACEPDCATAALGCGANSQCDASSGQAACVCAMGYQDNDMDGTCEPDCATAQAGGAASTAECPNCGTDFSSWETAKNAAVAACTASCSEGCTVPQNAGDNCSFEASINGYRCTSYCGFEPLECGANGQCDDASGAAICDCDAGYEGTPCALVYPESCAELAANGATNDGFYQLFVDHDPTRPWDAVCVGMQLATPRAYLPLGVTSGTSNRFQYRDAESLVAETSFWMVRIDPVTLLVNVEDFTFSRTVYYKNMSTRRVPYGTAESCTRQNTDSSLWATAAGKIDLRNTPFAVDDTFVGFDRCPQVMVTEDAVPANVVDLSIDGGEPAPPMSMMPPPVECGRVGPDALADHVGTECMRNVTRTPNPALPTDEVLQLIYQGNAPRASQTPTTCLEVRVANPMAGDGDYTLYADRDPTKAWTATCKDMNTVAAGSFPTGSDVRATGPKEYITLVQQMNDSNLMRNGGDYSYNVTKETRYQKLRFDPRSFDVNIRDTTYTTTTKFDPGQNLDPIFYANVGSCSGNCCGSNFPGRAKLDLRGTGFAVDDGFLNKGYCSRYSASYSNGDQVVDLEGDGQCGEVAPVRLAMQSGDSCLNRPAEFYSEEDFVLHLSYP